MGTNLQVFTHEQFGDIRIRVNANNDIEINLEDAARGLGFVQVHNERVTTSGYNYAAVRWDRIRGYLDSFGYTGEVSKDAYIPEHVFYRLAMKANNEAAEKFQDWIAREVIPSIRKNGYYVITKPVGNPEFPPELSKLWADVKTGEALIEAAKLTTDRKFREEIVSEAVRILTGGKVIRGKNYSDWEYDGDNDI